MAVIIIWFLIQICLNSLEGTNYSCSSNSTCGCSLKSAIVTKIVGGEVAEEDTWSWAVSIRSSSNHLCGGSLISPSLVLTAAHCFASKSTLAGFSVTAGSRSLSVIKQERSIAKVYIHRSYNSNSDRYTNDIAVLALSSPFDMKNSPLASICIPTSSMGNNIDNINVVAIGWGVIVRGETTPDILQQVTLKTVANNHSTCRLSIRNETVQLCAGVSGGGKDTCQGDSGGPLMMFSNKQWYLIGITSYGRDCGLPNYAGVYTRVSAYEGSINCILKDNTTCIEKTFTIRNSVSSISSNIFSILISLYFIRI